MKNVNISTVDELKRLLLPSRLYKAFGWAKGSKLTTQLNESGKTIGITAKDDGEILIDDLGRVTLSKDLCTALDWNTAEKITITVDENSKFLHLSKAS